MIIIASSISILFCIASKDIQNKIDIDDRHCIIIPRKVIGCKFFSSSSSSYEIKLTFPFIKMEIIQGQRNKFQPKAAFAYKFKKKATPRIIQIVKRI
jgi:hypothetical protein